MIGLLFSTEQEAGPFLAQYERGRFEGLSEGETVHDERIYVTLVGTGKIKATLRTERLLRSIKPKRVVLAGTCTALNERLETGQVVGVSEVFEGDRIEMAVPTYPRMPLDVPYPSLATGTLVTQDHTPHSNDERNYWQRIADMSDMVGYPVAFVAGTHGIPCHIVKVVAGHAFRPDDQLQKTLGHAYQVLADFLIGRLAK